jgi:hypothetical protein
MMRFRYVTVLCQRYGTTDGIKQMGTHSSSENGCGSWVALSVHPIILVLIPNAKLHIVFIRDHFESLSELSRSNSQTRTPFPKLLFNFIFPSYLWVGLRQVG